MQSEQFTRYYKVIRRGADDIYMKEETLEDILRNPNQLIKWNNDGDWRLINKADIIDAHFDREYSRDMKMKEQKKTVSLYLDKQKGVVKEFLDGQLPDDLTRYEKI